MSNAIPRGRSECVHCGLEDGHTSTCPVRPGRLSWHDYLGYAGFIFSVAVMGGALGWLGAIIGRAL